MTKYHYCKN